MIELCENCGAAVAPGAPCTCGGVTAAPLALDLDIRLPPVAASVAPKPMPMPMSPRPMSLSPRPLSRPPPPPPRVVDLGTPIKLLIVAGVLAAIGAALWFGVSMLRGWGEGAVDEGLTRPYSAPSRLVIAAVPSDYGSSITDDGSVLLRKEPRGSAAGLAGFYAAPASRVAGAVGAAVAAIPGATYRALEAPAGKCRSDAETSESTLGEISIGQEKITVFTCAITKKSHLYFLAWAAASSDIGDRGRLERMLKTSQLVSSTLCAVNVINGGCSPSASALVTTLVESARR